MNLFWKKIFGGISSTAKLEKEEIELVKAMQRYAEVEKSVELAEYKKLYHVVKSAEFQEKKKTLQNRKYKDTEEYRVSSKFENLKNSADLQHYLRLVESNELKEFLKFEKSKEFEQLGDAKKVEASPLLQRMKAYQKSKDFALYSRFHNSFILKEYEELKAKVSSPEFKKNDEFWKNEKRWHSTPEFAQQERFYELAKNPDVEFYNNEKPERFDKYRSLKLIFQEEFSWNSLDKSHWSFGFHYKKPEFIGDHSFANEKQAYNGGKNVSVENGTLKIATKHEKTTARAWDEKKGFIQKEFEYSSDVLQTADTFKLKYGVIRAKIRCTGNAHHAFWLGSEGKLPHVNIFHFDGKKIQVGNANKTVFDSAVVTGINASDFYIYTLMWNKKELIWMINDVEIYRTSSNVPNEEMFLTLNSFIPETSHGGAGSLEVDWIRVYAN